MSARVVNGKGGGTIPKGAMYLYSGMQGVHIRNYDLKKYRP